MYFIPRERHVNPFVWVTIVQAWLFVDIKWRLWELRICSAVALSEILSQNCLSSWCIQNQRRSPPYQSLHAHHPHMKLATRKMVMMLLLIQIWFSWTRECFDSQNLTCLNSLLLPTDAHNVKIRRVIKTF